MLGRRGGGDPAVGRYATRAQGPAGARGAAPHGAQRENARHSRFSGRRLSQAPAGYSPLHRGRTASGRAGGVRGGVVDAILATGKTLHGWAARVRDRRGLLRGRDTAYAYAVTSAMHTGGRCPALATWRAAGADHTRPLFRTDSRTLHELRRRHSPRRAAGVPTPEVVA